MAGEIKFWNVVGEPQVCHVKIRVVVGNSFEMMNQPFAGDIIRDNNITDSEPLQYRCNNVVRVYISVQKLKLIHVQRGPTAHTVLLAAGR